MYFRWFCEDFIISSHFLYDSSELSSSNTFDKDAVNHTLKSLLSLLAIVGENIEETFSGVCEGVLLSARRGKGGFGYDPLFLPHESDSTFAEISLDEKAKISHRARALLKLIEWISNQTLRK